MRKLLSVCLFVITLGSFSLGEAATIYQQPAHTDVINTNFSTIFGLGTGFSGYFADVDVWIRNSSAVTGNATVACYTDATYSTQCPSTEPLGAGRTVTVTYTIPTTTGGAAVSLPFQGATTSGARILSPTRYYRLNVSNGGTGTLSLYGITSPNVCLSNCSGSPYIVLTSGINWEQYLNSFTYSTTSVTIATTSGLTAFVSATATLEAMAGSCAQSGNIFGEALCVAFSYLFLPNPTVLNNWSNLPTEVQEKFPFSWIVGVQGAVTGLTASTTENAPTYDIDLSDLGIGSTTAMGNILPNFTAFSSTTVLGYMPAGVWAAGQALMAAVLWLALGFDIYMTVRRRHAHV